MTNDPAFRFSIATTAYWFLALSIGMTLIRYATPRGLPASFDVCALFGFFLIGACVGLPIGHYAKGAAGARTGALIGGIVLLVVGGFGWLLLR